MKKDLPGRYDVILGSRLIMGVCAKSKSWKERESSE